MRELSIKKSIDSAKTPPVDSLAFSKDALFKYAQSKKGKPKVDPSKKGLSKGTDAYAAMAYVRPRLSSYKEMFEKALEEKRKKDPTADHLVEEEMDVVSGGKAKEYGDLAEAWKSYRDTTTLAEEDVTKDENQESSVSGNYDPVKGGSLFFDVNTKPKLTYYSDRGSSKIKTPQQLDEKKKKLASTKKVK